MYQSYISHEMAEKEPARIQCIYERAIQDNCLAAELWIQYTKYLVISLFPVLLNFSEAYLLSD